MRKHETILAADSGYVLNPKRSYFAVVVPEDTVNLVINPECHDTTTYTAVSATRAVSSAEQRRGAHSLLVTPSAANGGVYATLAEELTVGESYTFSVDILGQGRFDIFFSNSSGAQLGASRTVNGTGFWIRESVTVIAVANMVSVSVRSVDEQVFYVDGLQCENKAYATTFVSGNIEVRPDTATRGRMNYGWFGAPHRSMSFRTKFAINGGRPIPMSDLGFEVTDFSGFGHAAPELVTSAMAFSRDRLYMGYTLPERQFTIGGYVHGEQFRDLVLKRGGIGDALYGASAEPAPILLHIQLFDDNMPISEVAELECMYMGGFEGTITALYQEKSTITFRTWAPFLRLTGNRAQSLDIDPTSANTNITAIYEDGTSEALATYPATWSASEPGTLAWGMNGALYEGRGDEVIQQSQGSYSLLGPDGMIVIDMLTAPDGRLYILQEDDEDTPNYLGRIQRTQPYSSTLDSGWVVTLSTNEIDDLVLGHLRYDEVSNRVFVTGNFENASYNGAPQTGTYGGMTSIIAFDLTTMSFYDFKTLRNYDLDNDHNPIVYDVAFIGGVPYICGSFKYGATPSAPSYTTPWAIAYWEQETEEWRGGAMTFGSASSHLDHNTTTCPKVMCASPLTGEIFVGGGRFYIWWYIASTGSWTLLNSTTLGLAYLTTYGLGIWPAPEYGVRMAGMVTTNAEVFDLTLANNKRDIYVAGNFELVVNPVPGGYKAETAVGIAKLDAQSYKLSGIGRGVPLPATSVVQSSGAGVQTAYQQVVPAAFSQWALDMDLDAMANANNAIFVAHNDATNSYSTPVTTITLPNGARALPRIEIRGSCLVRKIINATTGRILSPNLTVNANETVVISLSPGPVWVRSTTRGDMTYPNMGRDAFPDLGLVHGNNNIVVDATSYDANAAVDIYWQEEYASFDTLVARNA